MRIRSGRLIAAIVAAAATVGLGAAPASAADVEGFVGYYCDGDATGVGPVGCAWLNVDHTNNRVRAYARATMSAGYGEIAARYVRVQRWDGVVWKDVPGTMVNDLDGWQSPRTRQRRRPVRASVCSWRVGAIRHAGRLQHQYGHRIRPLRMGRAQQLLSDN